MRLDRRQEGVRAGFLSGSHEGVVGALKIDRSIQTQAHQPCTYKKHWVSHSHFTLTPRGIIPTPIPTVPTLIQSHSCTNSIIQPPIQTHTSSHTANTQQRRTTQNTQLSKPHPPLIPRFTSIYLPPKTAQLSSLNTNNASRCLTNNPNSPTTTCIPVISIASLSSLNGPLHTNHRFNNVKLLVSTTLP